MMPILLAAAEVPVRGDTNVELAFGIVLFLVTGILVPFAILLVGSFLRPAVPNPEKGLPYECGEPVIGESWIQFDLRFYIVALFFIVFDVEIALLWPWAVVYKQFGAFGLGAMLFFLLPILVGFFYEWRFGYLDWVRADTAQRRESLAAPAATGGAAT